MIAKLTDRAAVAPQLHPADLAAVAAAGYTTLINNRPDGESPGQPAGAAVAAAAAAAGLTYVAIPVDHSGFGPGQIAAMASAIAASPGPVLAFCRSGTRSAHLWAMAEASRGEDPDALIAAADAGGYDLAMLLPMLRRLAPA